VSDFASGFTSTFSAMSNVLQGRQELELRKKDADLRGKLIDLQMEQLQQKIKSGQLLRNALGATEPAPRAGTPLDLEANPEAAGTMPPTQRKTLNLREIALSLAPVDPDAAVRILLDQEKAERTTRASGQVLDLFGKLTGGTRPTAPSAAPEAPAAVAAGGAAPSMSLEPTLSMDKEGGLSLSIAGKPPQLQRSTQTLQLPNGQAQVYATVFDPKTGQETTWPIGMAMPSEAMQRAEAAVAQLGIERSAPLFGHVVGAVSRAMLLEGPARSERLATIEDEVQRLPPAAKTGAALATLTPGGTRAAIEAAEQRQTGVKAKDVTAVTGAKQATEPEDLLSPEEAARVGVPYGTTKREAFGRQPLTTQKETQQQAYDASLKIVSQMDKLIGDIRLPKTAGERISAAPRLRLEAFKQSNISLNLFDTLKEGVLANIVRAFGERGTLTDQDIARARALFPVVVPGLGGLPDTEAVAQAKLKQLRELIGELGTRPTPSKPAEPAATPAPPGFRRER